MKPSAAATRKRFDKIRTELQNQNSPKAPRAAGETGVGDRLDVPAYCSSFGVEIVATKEASGGGTMYCLKRCAFDENHGPNHASIIQRTNGKLSYQCFHDSCKGRTWEQARHQFSGKEKLDKWMVEVNNAEGKEKHADALISIGKTAELFMAPDGTMWARFKTGGHLECWQIVSRAYQNWVVRQFYQQTGTAPSVMAVNAAMKVLESEAQFGQDGNPREIFTRVAVHNGEIYLDLADKAWRAVKITPDGWSIVEEPPVCFRRTRGMLPLPEPVRGESLQLLEHLVDLGNEENRKLILSWLVYCLNPYGPYPILCLISEQGSGKSVMSKILRNTVDPNKSPIRGLPTSLEDLAITGQHSWIPCFDNISYISEHFSDALCRMSTGGGFGTRAHYTNDDLALFNASRPIILNGISHFLTRPDLLERAIIVRLPSIEPENRRTERVILAAFDQLRPALLGAVLDAVVLALKNQPNVNLSVSPRMADFAEWTAAIAPAVEADPGEMASLLIETQNEALLSQMDTPLPQAVLKLLAARGGKYEGYVLDLLNDLSEHAPKYVTNQSSWPRTAKGLQNAMVRIVPVLRAAGVNYQEFKRTNKGRPVMLERVGTGLKGEGRRPNVTEQKGSVAEHRHELTPGNQAKSDETGQSCDGSDGPPRTFSPSFALRKKEKKEEGEGDSEKVAAAPSPPSLRHCADLLEGEL